MGILKLNNLFNTCPTEELNKPYNIVIVDGSNIIIQTLCSQLSQMKKSGLLIQQWDSVNADLLTQISYIIRYSIESIHNTLQHYYDQGAEEVILVLDPIESPKYLIRSSFEYNHEYQDILDPDLKNGVDIDFDIKSDEQEKRRAAADKSKEKNEYIQEIETLDSLDPSDREKLVSVFKQSFTFNEMKELTRLGKYILKEVYRSFKGKTFKIINAIDEADLVIKNVAAEYDSSKLILVLSMDTDYNVLFGDMPNVDTCSLTKRYTIYNPCRCWKSLFKESACFDYDHILRCAALFGNDYTVKQFLVSAPNFSDVLKLFEGRIKQLRAGARSKKITTFANTITDEDFDSSDLLPLELLDKFLYKWNENYFRQYYMSNIIYTNWTIYNRYELMPEPDELACTQELEAFWTSFITAPFKLYKWQSEYIFKDWHKFFETLEIVEFDCVDVLIDYYYEHEYHDEAADFL